jgi:hypothetical protein
MQLYLAKNTTAVLPTDELLRAEWVSRVSALDLYVHELVAQRMLASFEGYLARTDQFNAFRVSMETVERIRTAASAADASSAFDLEVRRQLGFISFQDPEKIADGIRLCSGVELWNAVALHQGATQATKSELAKKIKRQLSAIVERRNKIAHEGDLQPALAITPWSVNQTDLVTVANFIERTVDSIDACV